MIPGVTFGDKHCYNDFGLILAQKVIGMPEPRTNLIDVPGRDGQLDLSEALTGEINYKNRVLSLTFVTTETLSGQAWYELLSNVGNYLHGRRMNIAFDGETDFYYSGRCSIDSFETQRAKQTVAVKCDCAPYKLHRLETVVTAQLTGEDVEITLVNDRMPVVPVITVDAETLLTWGGGTYTVSPGAHSLTALRLTAGSHTLKARAVSGAGTITITYREGSL